MSLSVKIIGLILLALTGLLSVFGWLFISDEEKVLQELLDKQGKALAHAVSTFSIEPLLVEDYPVLETVLQNIGQQTADILSVEVLHEGKRVAGYRRTDVSRGRTFHHDITFPRANGKSGIRLGEVRLALSEDSNRLIVAQRLGEMRVFIGLTFLMLLLVLATILRRTVLHPVEELTKYAERITNDQEHALRSAGAAQVDTARDDIAGNGDSRYRGDEIRRLSSSLASMHQAIVDKDALLKQYTRDLERKVEGRTRELRVAKDKAETSDRAKSVFLANMSHEIRTPMNGVLGFAKLLAQTKLNGDQQEYARIISVSADNLRVIIDDILDYTKLEVGRLEIEQRRFNLHEVVDATVGLLAPQAYEKGLELVHAIAAATPVRLIGDAVRVRQILTNLIANGIKFTPKGTVSLWIEQLDSRLRFEVADTGIGIAESDAQRLFQPFSQADASMTRRFGGTGLGLAISKQLVDRMHGRIGVESQADRGSLFWFDLPLRVQEASTPEDDRRAGVADLRALVYDPSELARRAIGHTLMRMGFTVQTVGSLEGLAGLADRGAARADDLLVLGLGAQSDYDRRRLTASSLTAEKRLRIVLLCNETARQSVAGELGIPASLVLAKATGYAALADALEQLMGGSTAPGFNGRQTADEGPWVDPQLATLKVLVVDDNAINLKLTTALLESWGVGVLAATDGEQAVRLAQDSVLDMILMDIQMPGMSGLDATRVIRQGESAGRHTPIIAVTAHAYPEEQQRFLSEGMDACITKPLDSDRLWRLLHHRTVATCGELAEETPAENDTKNMIYDRTAALLVTGGNEGLADKIWNMLLEQLPKDQACLEQALHEEDLDALRERAHSVVGSAAYCCTPGLKSAASRLEHAIREGRKVALESLVDSVGRQIARLRALGPRRGHRGTRSVGEAG